MLYPKEDKMTSKLMYACRTCQSSQEATSSCVFRNYLSTNVGETAGVTQDVGNDPTVRFSALFLCLLCGMDVVEGGGQEEEEEEEERNAGGDFESSEDVIDLEIAWNDEGDGGSREGEMGEMES